MTGVTCDRPIESVGPVHHHLVVSSDQNMCKGSTAYRLATQVIIASPSICIQLVVVYLVELAVEEGLRHVTSVS